ncbi:MAG: glycosyltransferase 61 family protein [Chthoniobacter sp.]|nr:glycosyltransferase 61 family protein [Chthoniobacter sp.]
MRDEASYIEEWVEHYRRQGVTKWHIYDNGSIDATPEVLRGLGIEPVIWADHPDNFDVQQKKAYTEGCRVLSTGTDWVAFIDVDEFLFGRGGKTLVEALASIPDDVSAIAVQQVVFGSSGHLRRVPGRVIDRFTRCAPRSHPECLWFKTIARPGEVVRFDSVHSVVLHAGRYSMADGSPLTRIDVHPGVASRRVEGTLGLHHYILKSREEFEQKSAKWSDRHDGPMKREFYFVNRESYANTDECLDLADHPVPAPATEIVPIRIGRFFVGDLPPVTEFDALIAALSFDRHDDVAFVHAPSFPVEFDPEIAGLNCFGSGKISTKNDQVVTREVASAVLNDGIYSGNSLSIIDSKYRLFVPAFENVKPAERLAGYDPVYTLSEGVLCLNPGTERIATDLDGVLVPVCAAGAPNYGHYLFDGLGTAFLLAKLLPSGTVKVAGQGLKEWQRQILDALGLLDSYTEIRGPVRFRKMVASTTLSLHISYPTAVARPIFDALRFRFGSATAPARKLFISRQSFAHRLFVNREEVEALATGMGFEIVRPEEMPVGDQVRMFAEAKVVVGEAGAALANVGFCHPGAAVLEIQTERFGDSWIRSTCLLMGLRWHVFHAPNVPAPPGTELAYHVDPAEFRDAISAILKRVP